MSFPSRNLKLDFTISIPNGYQFSNSLFRESPNVAETPNLESSSLTYSYLSKFIINHLESYDQTVKGFIEREVVTRGLASLVSFFQFADLVQATSSLVGRVADLTGHFIGIKKLSDEQVQTIKQQAQGNLLEMASCVFGVFFGSIISMINPSCFVPFLYAPNLTILNDPIDPSQRYDFDRHFGKTLAINLQSATRKIEVLGNHLREIGVQNWERFNAVNGYAIPDDQPIQIKDQSVRFKDLYERMPGSSERHKRARLGCYLSHLFAIKQARDARLESVLIIEDDAIFPQTKRGVESFNSAIQELPNDWEVFFVGIEHDKKPSRFSAHVDHVQSGTCLHAYAVHSRAYDRLIDDIESALLNDQDQLLPVDEVVSEQLEKNKYKAFAPHTLVGYQRDGLTSNITGKVNSDYSFPMRLIKRLYSHMLAPVLSPLGLTKYRIYKTALSTAKRLNLGA